MMIVMTTSSEIQRRATFEVTIRFPLGFFILFLTVSTFYLINKVKTQRVNI